MRIRAEYAGNYKELGSANVLIEPASPYLCIAAAPARSPRIMLPLDGDEVLSVTMSKMALLAADGTITDPGMPRRLPRRS